MIHTFFNGTNLAFLCKLKSIQMRLITKLKDFHCKAYHGIYAQELQNGGPFIVNIEVTQKFQDQTPLNNLEQLVNYELLLAITREQMAIPRPLIETVAQSILAQINNQFQDLFQIKVEIIKVDPMQLFDKANVAVELIQEC